MQGLGQGDGSLADAVRRDLLCHGVEPKLALGRRQQAALTAFSLERDQRLRVIADLKAREERLRGQKEDLANASTVVECMNAAKSVETGDLGQGNPTRGTMAHLRHGMEVLSRIRSGGATLKPDLQNDWNRLKRIWDAARLCSLPARNESALWAQFKAMMKGSWKRSGRARPQP